MVTLKNPDYRISDYIRARPIRAFSNMYAIILNHDSIEGIKRGLLTCARVSEGLGIISR